MQEILFQEAESTRDVVRMRALLESRLRTMANRYQAAANALSELRRSVDLDNRMATQREALEEVFRVWIDEHIQATSEACKGCAEGQIQKSELSDKYQSVAAAIPDVERELRMGNVDLDSAIEALVEQFDYAGFGEELDRIGAGLEDRGLREAANLIARELGIQKNSSRDYQPKATKRHFEFTRTLYTDYSGYSYSFREGLTKLVEAFEVAERDAGLQGVGYSMRTIARAFEQLGYGELFDTWTVLNEGGAVEMVAFKCKLVFRLNHANGDGLLAFLRIHSDVDLKELPAAC